MTDTSAKYTEKPVIVIVPGSFSTPIFYAVIVERLRSHGYEASVVRIPSVGRRDPLPPATMQDDADFISSITSKLADEGKRVVMITHSYGGICGTQSLKGVSVKERKATGKSGGVERIVYFTSYVPMVGKSLQSLMGPGIAPFLTISEDYMSQDPVGSGKFNFTDMPEYEGIEWAKLLLDHSTVTFGAELTHPGYHDVAVSYLFCSKDQTLAPELQHRMVDALVQSGVNVETHTIAAGHCANVSVPLTVEKTILEAIGDKQ